MALNAKYSHGLSQEQFDALCVKDSVCAICGRAGKLDIDHDHTTEKVRGRLCVKCNTGLGKLGDTLPMVMRAIKYLQERTC